MSTTQATTTPPTPSSTLDGRSSERFPSIAASQLGRDGFVLLPVVGADPEGALGPVA